MEIIWVCIFITRALINFCSFLQIVFQQLFQWRFPISVQLIRYALDDFSLLSRPVWECIPWQTKRLVKVMEATLFESPHELFLCFVQPNHDLDLISISHSCRVVPFAHSLVVHGVPLKGKAPCTHHVALALFPVLKSEPRHSVVRFKYEQHSEFPRSCYTSLGWAESSVGLFDGKYTTFFNQGTILNTNCLVI